MKVYNVIGNILDVEIVSDTVMPDDIKKIESVMDKMLTQYEKISIRITLGRHLEMTLKTQLEVLKTGIQMHKHIHRLAVIGDREVLKLLTTVDNLMVPWQEKYFHIDDLENAEKWLKED